MQFEESEPVSWSSEVEAYQALQVIQKVLCSHQPSSCSLCSCPCGLSTPLYSSNLFDGESEKLQTGGKTKAL